MELHKIFEVFLDNIVLLVNLFGIANTMSEIILIFFWSSFGNKQRHDILYFLYVAWMEIVI